MKRKLNESVIATKKITNGSTVGQLVQSTFTSSSITCKVCAMTYTQLPKDRDLHKRHHHLFINGVSWPRSQDAPVMKTTVRKIDSSTSYQVEIYTVDKSSTVQIRRVEELLKMVNSELNAPQDSQEWKSNNPAVAVPARAFVAVVNGRAVAVCTTDSIHDTDLQCRWMVYKSQKIVPGQVNRAIRLGISRIWTASNYRRLGIADKLLQCVLEHSVFGVTLAKSELGFSQPSFAGGLLAKHFNGVIHKSGETLIPVYIED